MKQIATLQKYMDQMVERCQQQTTELHGEKPVSLANFLHKSHKNWPGIEGGPQW